MLRARTISDYGLIGDGHSAALVDTRGSLAWLCWPRFDSPAVFASLLGDDENGVWSLNPVGAFESTRRYRPDTLILETHFRTETGEALLTDFMPYNGNPRAVIRRIRCIAGSIQMVALFAPRPNNGADQPRYERIDRALHIEGEDIALVLSASRPELLRINAPVRFELREGDEVDFALTHANAPATLSTFAKAAADSCEAFWHEWTAKCVYQGPWRGNVLRSLITLKALIYAPTGGIVAAPTSSLPERIGGHRNWDYRYCWLRDSTFTVLALLHAGYSDEAGAWVNWLVSAAGHKAQRAQVFYGVVPGGEIGEFEAQWLRGFNGSRPVRFGNAARDQIQLGVYGEVQDTLHQWRLATGKEETRTWEMQHAMLGRLSTIMTRPGAGIWEQRGRLDCFVQSRALAWVAFDRALRTADKFNLEADASWIGSRAALHREVCEKGFDSELQSFTRAYGSHSLDASCLLLAMVGFLPANDPRIDGTVRAIQRHLSDGPFVYRYDVVRDDDGIGGPEGAFLPCSYWLADNLILQGKDDEAAAIFERLLGAGNDLGLYSEEYDVADKSLLGNFPQALTHLSLIHTALNLTGSGPAHSRSKAAC